MQDRMYRFLASIHIEDIDNFDMDFDSISHDRFITNKWNMIINKETPWEYHLLREFQDALMTIDYQYTLHFSYRQKPTSEDAISLFPDWYQTIYRVPNPHQLRIKDENTICLLVEDINSFNNNDIVDSFNDFLNSFLNYEITLEVEEYKEEKKVILSKRKMNQITKAADESATKDIESDVSPTSQNVDIQQADYTREEEERDILKEVESEHAENQKSAEALLIAEMKHNYEIMERERERIRLNRRGNYMPIDFIDAIDTSCSNIDFVGKVFSYDEREFGDGRRRINLGLYDNAGGAIYVNTTVTMSQDVINEIKKRGTNVRVKGAVYQDKFSKDMSVRGHSISILPPDEPRKDLSEKKRVELHLHSQMSVQDGVGSMDQYCRLAKAMGHTAIAITDHGVVQGYPDAQAAAKKHGLKMLYGSELYMVDDKEVYVFNPTKVRLNSATYVVFDLETTGLSTYYDRIIEFGAVKVEKGLVTQQLDILINPERSLPKKISEITNISDEMLKDQPTIHDVLDKILDFIGDSILVSHNAAFDFGFIQEALKRDGREILHNPVVDTLALSRYLFPTSRNHRLGALCRNMDIFYDEDEAHRADYDARVLNDVWQPMLVKLTKSNFNMTHEELGKLETPSELLVHIRPVHVTVLAKNKQGLKDLYRLITIGHIDYLSDVPKVPRRAIEKYRENLIIGSACFNGEVFRTARYYNFERLKQVVDFYDFIEVQPPENYSFLINTEEVDSNEELLKYLRDIMNAADEMHKPICATGDVHYCNPEDKIFRDIYVSAMAVGNVAHPLNPYARQRGKYGIFENPDQHYRSTDEMLEAFSWLNDEKKIEEIVIDNPNKIADSIEAFEPLPNDHLYTPTIDNCENDLSDLVYSNAKKLYGDPLPEYIQKRLETELTGIISHGYSVIYWIAHKLIKKTNDDGYIVGSRGSVGSSLVATMANITEVNPLPPHYVCPECHHFEWTSESMPNITSGYDLPNKKCPHCGHEMIHDGQNIPFETFLGFNADKTPDIDLNFPPDYQAKAHDYTKVLLGEDNVFRAGTIETVAEKTAFGFAKGYLERTFALQGMSKEEASAKVATYPRAKVAYLASGCVDVKRTTGQHPGGIVVIPRDYEVYDFTPVQYPADDKDASWKTTHFDFHSIHDTILKLDLLGHVDPMALKMMCDLTGIKLKEIPMNDKNVLSLFSSPKALKMKRNYLNQQTGAMAIPEFGTNFVRGILEATRPQSFSELVIISGLSHGTNVWNGNAEKLIQDKTATLKEVIGCRDDIMTYLISKGVPSKISFSIMEDVRKGKGLKEEYVNIMKAKNIPDYYLDSCNKIKYMFPKGHAVAYVTMAIRVGYFKIYYPLEFYATFFSVRSKQYDIQTMIKGETAIIEKLEWLRRKERDNNEILSPKEDEILKTLQIAIEMEERGFTFSNIDLYKSDASNFVVDREHGCLIPPFSTIDGLGESAAQSIIEARKDGPFLSKEELLRRTKLNGTNVKDMSALGVLDGIPENDQLSLFDF